MKPLILFIFSILISTSTIAQKSPRLLTPITGHYKELAKLSPKALPDSSDRNQFPVEGLPLTTWTRLTLKPAYLIIPVTDFSIPHFPANSSLQTKAEIEFLLNLQASARTPEKVKESLEFAEVYYSPKATPQSPNWQKLRTNLFHMGRQLPWFNPAQLPITANFMAKVWADCSYYFWALKYQFNRTRPYMLDALIKNLDNTNFQAYPSGHSSASYMAAYVYQELLPENTDLFLKNAYDMAYSREILGVHFPSDSEAGRIFARQFVNFLLENPAFQKDLAEAKKEIEKVKNQSK
jgi:acid phosphatase (class A)